MWIVGEEAARELKTDVTRERVRELFQPDGGTQSAQLKSSGQHLFGVQ